MVTSATPISKRVIAGGLLLLFWIGIFAIQDISLSTQGWAALVPLRCPLAWILDIPCPTCGLGRALIAAALFHGQESFRFHPFGLPIFWGSQGLLLCWMLWPEGWTLVRRFWQGLARRRGLLWSLVALYSIWGFCWRKGI